MNRMRAEKEAASRNSDKAMTKGGLSYTAEFGLVSNNIRHWAVVTWQNGKEIQREY